MHAAADGDAALGLNVDVDERLDETRGLSLQLRIALDVGVGVGDACLQGLHLSVDANLGSRQSRYPHFHLDKLYATFLLGLGSHLFHLADGSLCKVCDAQSFYEVVHDLSLDWCRFHVFIICFIISHFSFLISHFSFLISHSSFLI